jgi:hypothetical protein
VLNLSAFSIRDVQSCQKHKQNTNKTGAKQTPSFCHNSRRVVSRVTPVTVAWHILDPYWVTRLDAVCHNDLHCYMFPHTEIHCIRQYQEMYNQSWRYNYIFIDQYSRPDDVLSACNEHSYKTITISFFSSYVAYNLQSFFFDGNAPRVDSSFNGRDPFPM